jgi:N-acetylmuramoyl-L-alanine amidase
MTNNLLKILFLAVLVQLGATQASAFFIDRAGGGEDSLDIIVIDPGHGGEDSGAVGPRGGVEKDIALNVARRLAAALEAKLGCTVLLTRDGDTTMTLDERVAFANRNDADIFISIHANAARNRKASGIETFFMSYEATDAEAALVAEKENSVAVKDGDGAAMDGVTDDLKNMLLDMAQSVTHHESFRLAESVHKSMVKGTRRGDRGVKQAPFVVLYGALMPAILVEVGFISNAKELVRLKSPKYQARMANSIVDGIIGFGRLTGMSIGKKNEEDKGVGISWTAKEIRR